MGTTSRGNTELAPWVLPKEPVPVRLMNTIWADRAGVHDSLTTPSDLATWLTSIGVAQDPVRVSDGDLSGARRLRDALRRVAALCTQDTREAAASPITEIEDAIAEINTAVIASLPAVRMVLSKGRLHREPVILGPQVTTALSMVAADAIDLFTDAHSPALSACQAPGCVLYFTKDHPRREWCSTACGNRARAARHYRRHRAHMGSGVHIQ